LTPSWSTSTTTTAPISPHAHPVQGCRTPSEGERDVRGTENHPDGESGRTLSVGDVNGDNNPDIYVVCGKTGTANAPDHLLLGHATGGFTTATIPEATAGTGEEAYPIDYTHDGLSSFLVLNGQVPNPGPIQLLTPQPSSSGTLTRTVSFQHGAAR
jgi:hypothetical protein